MEGDTDTGAALLVEGSAGIAKALPVEGVVSLVMPEGTALPVEGDTRRPAVKAGET